MARLRLLTALSFVTLSLTHAQCSNEVAQLFPTFRTMSTNNTWFLVPVPLVSVQAAVAESFPLAFSSVSGTNRLSLLSLPAGLNFPPNTHPVLVASGLDADIRQDKLQIDGPLLGSSLIVPFVGRGGSTTPLNAPLIAYLAGTNEATHRYLAALIPTAVATLVGGLPSKIGSFVPDYAAWQVNNNGLLSANSKHAVLPNQGSGPGVYIEALDLLFSPTSTSTYTLSTWKSILNQPYLLNGALTGRCQRNTYYLNTGTAGVTWRNGGVIFGPAAGADEVKATLHKSKPNGVYEGLQGFSACAQLVGYDGVVAIGEECEEAARKVREDVDAL